MKTLFSILLSPIAIIYGSVVMLRNVLFDIGLLSSVSFNIPIINVGNLSVGGTGKTPHVKLLIEILAKKDYHVAVLSRGYGRSSRGFHVVQTSSTPEMVGDEPLEIKLGFPNAIVAVCESRVQGVRELMKLKQTPDVIVLDDAFQHRWIKSGYSILLTKHSRPYFRDFMLPSGKLREPAFGSKRADVILVTKCPDIDNNEAASLEKNLDIQQHQQLFFSKVSYGKPHHLFTPDQFIDLESKTRKIHLITGIANTFELETYLKSFSNTLHHWKQKDHHSFNKTEVDRYVAKFNSDTSSDKILLTTEKDAVKLRTFEVLKDLPFFVLPISVKIGDFENFKEGINEFLTSTK